MGAGLFIWSLIISLLAIPELWLIMMQFWVSLLPEFMKDVEHFNKHLCFLGLGIKPWHHRSRRIFYKINN